MEDNDFGDEEEEYIYEEEAEYAYEEEAEEYDELEEGNMGEPAAAASSAAATTASGGSAIKALTVGADTSKDVQTHLSPDFSSSTPVGASAGATGSVSAGSRRGSLEPLRELTIPTDNFVIVNCSEVEPLMNKYIDEVAALLDLSIDEAITLLRYNVWDKEKLIDKYFSDADKMRKAAGLEHFDSRHISEQIASMMEGSAPASAGSGSDTGGASKDDGKSGDTADVFLCRVCYDPAVPMRQSFCLGCEHKFCITCFRAYLHNQLGEGQTCILTVCPEHKCNEIVTSRIYHAFLPAEAPKVFDRFLLRHYIENSKRMKYCPAPGCDKVALGSGITMARCTCGHPFCFKAHCTSDEAHDPCSCAQLAEWQMKCHNESETANWILANTRKCPECNARIEKNQGCNHMTCRLCKHEFCWICMGNWAEHGQQTGGYYKCNRFNPAEANGAVSEAQKAKVELEKYLHYYKRYHGHDHALRFASSARAQAEARMVEQQEQLKTSWIDVQFLKQAAEQLIDCRRVLKYTYVLGYYLKDGSVEKQLFEHHQEMLEKNTEKLQEYTERSLDTIDRTEVVNLTRVTEKFMSSLLASMTGGVVTVDASVAPALVLGSDTAQQEGQLKAGGASAGAASGGSSSSSGNGDRRSKSSKRSNS